MHVAAIIAAAGRGRRLGGTELKQLLSVGGRPVLERSVTAFLRHRAIDEIVVALPQELVDELPPCLRNAPKRLHVVAGGPRRQDSVANAFRALGGRAEVVVIHDAARPFVSASLIEQTIAAAAESGAALAALPARDTVKQARVWHGGSGPTSADGLMVGATLPRESIFLAQTPQAFRRDVLRAALAAGADGIDATDEAALAERAGHAVRLVEGEVLNIKFTTPDDLPIAEAIARALDGSGLEAERGVVGRTEHFEGAEAVGTPVAPRVGTGYDLHRLVAGRPLVLGGVTIPFDRGLAGHSDADAICHAIIDALLGAAAAGDIGRHFPDADPLWRGASSIGLLSRAAALVRGFGFTIGNVDVVVIAEHPTLAPHVDAMRANVADALGVSVDRVSIKGKTNEGVGALGRGEAIAVHAVALVVSHADDQNQGLRS